MKTTAQNTTKNETAVKVAAAVAGIWFALFVSYVLFTANF